MDRRSEESRPAYSRGRAAGTSDGGRPKPGLRGNPGPRHSYRTLEPHRGGDAATRGVSTAATVETTQAAFPGVPRRKLHAQQARGPRIVQAMLVIALLALAAMLILYLTGPAPHEIAHGGAIAGQAVVAPSPTPSPTPVLAYQGPFAPGQNVRIVNTGACLNARTYPGVGAPVWSCLPDGTELRIVLGPIYSDTMWWWAAAQEGWVAEPYLAPAEEDGQ